MARPKSKPLWAMNYEPVDPIYGTPNRAAPSTDKQEVGQAGNQNTLRQDINYLFYTIATWINYFDTQSDLGDVESTTVVAETASTFSARMGGTWEDLGTTPMGSVTVRLFRKISDEDL